MRVRLMWVGLVLLSILVGCTSAVPVPRPGQLLYVTTFDAFNEDWEQFEGRLAAQVVGEGQNPALQLTIDNVQDGAFTVAEPVFSDFDLVVEVTQVAGPDNNGFGVLFRYQDTRNYYVFYISGDGWYSLEQRIDGVAEVLSDWSQSAAIRQGQATNTLRVVARGQTFSFFVNDEPLLLCPTLWNPANPSECMQGEASPELTVTSLPAQGRIGLGARTFDQSGVVIAFDNMLVCGPYETTSIPFMCEELPPGQAE
ncbi:MAG: hypothetical protein JW910_23835 [Anaerolineae bacterium]|nr:hypothetical protein [Anaerolineae bacterium]